MRGSRSCRTSRSHRGRAWSRGRDGEATPPGPEVARGLRCPPRPCRGGNVASAGLAGRTLCGAVAEAGIVSALPAELMSERDFTAAQASRRAGNRSMDASFMFSEPPRPRVRGRNARSSSGVVTPPSRPHPHARLPREPPAPQAEHERRLRVRRQRLGRGVPARGGALERGGGGTWPPPRIVAQTVVRYLLGLREKSCVCGFSHLTWRGLPWSN